jgi:hypothetical protein
VAHAKARCACAFPRPAAANDSYAVCCRIHLLLLVGEFGFSNADLPAAAWYFSSRCWSFFRPDGEK